MARLLIAYATVEGHTAKIAACMRDALESGAHEVQFVEVRDGHEELPAEIDVVIVGGSIHMGHPRRPSMRGRFARRRAGPRPTRWYSQAGWRGRSTTSSRGWS